MNAKAKSSGQTQGDLTMPMNENSRALNEFSSAILNRNKSP